MKVQDLMSPVVHTIGVDQSVNAAARAMWESDIGIVPVVDHEHRVVGMITDRDIAMAGFLQGRPFSQIAVRELMSRELVSIAPESTVEAALDSMARRQVRRLPVIDTNGRVVGMLSINDVAAAVADSEGPPSPADVLRTLRQIGAPRR
jgi:CBS domain-containing protein